MTNEKETHTIESWQSLVSIVKALGEYEKAINITQSEWCSIEHGDRKRFSRLYEGYVSNVVKSIGKVLVEVCDFCHLEGICFNDIVKNSRMIDTKTIDRNLMAWSGRLLVYECKSDICTILTHVFCILELKAIMLGSGIEVVESTGSIGVVTWSAPWNMTIQIKVFVKSSSPDVNEKENEARIIMCRRIEELMAEAEEWCEIEDLHDCVQKVLDERNAWQVRSKNKEYELDALIESQRLRFRKIAIEAVFPILTLNRSIVQQYGPNSLNFIPEQWTQKIITRVIPNNRNILDIIDANKVYLTDEESVIVEEFRAYVDRLESNHDELKLIPINIWTVFM